MRRDLHQLAAARRTPVHLIIRAFGAMVEEHQAPHPGRPSQSEGLLDDR